MNSENENRNKETVEHTRDCPVSAPDADIAETQDALFVVMDMPGVTEQAVRVELENDVLTVSAEPGPAEECALPMARREFCARAYHRAFRIDADVNPEDIQARMRHGVLKLTLPRRAPAQPRQIKVETGG